MTNPLRIMLADDHTLFREGIKIALASNPDIEVVGEASDGLEAITLARKTMPDIILMDISMPRCNGLQATMTISREMPHIKIVILTVSDQAQDLYEAIRAGATGYLLKDLQPKELFKAIEMIANGEVLLAGDVANKILDEFRHHPHPFTSDMELTDPLTEREYEVLGLVAKGLSNPEIADRLVISPNTVKNHLSNILSKLHLRNRIELTAYAIRKGFVKESR
ncbi:MAG: response regulator transcription factor [Chloroflexi bacterium]|nr:response regulator transcription factor [Chloroflexota bacterium]